MLLVSKYTAVKQLVNGHFQVSLSIYATYAKNLYIPKEENFVYQSREKGKVLYLSGIALKLAKAYQLDASAIASHIASHFLRNCDASFRVEVVKPAWIHIQVRDSVVAGCFQSVIEGMGEATSFLPSSISPSSDSLFSVQYAHARCCSLLKLGQREGLIQVNQQLQIPWLVDNEVVDGESKFRLTDLASRRLIGELVTALDDFAYLDNIDMRHWQKTGISISKAFEDFWRSCHIWGEVKMGLTELALARLGLVLVTQVVLQFLLEDKLGISALPEL
ncbi:DALR anticodon-binding domain-containing protein [Brunnivagina elsteri]|uniref:Glutamate acetyltransferase n=1 Tax=Brunnivagina elsteri CCALA 953 TaxID=987040 RepID=A0A2A2TCB1_9CYAN|nr:DALR anticodon-binding domain-containing protein [Calothrix elsteri]PAX51353.1 glutamate acetyltransferase [Calothrix elsteri CCALA 953]